MTACDDTYIPVDADIDAYEPPPVSFCCWDCGVYNCCKFRNDDTGSLWDYDSPLREDCGDTVSNLLDEGKTLDSDICVTLDRVECS